MHDVFISYSTKDTLIANAICNRLESGGVRCWYAPRDVQPGKSWAGELMRAIRAAKVFLLVYSEDYNKSQPVLSELTEAVDAKCTIVPFRVDTCDMNDDLAFYLKKVHWLDALNPPTKEQIDNLYIHICTILGIQPDGGNPPPPPPGPTLWERIRKFFEPKWRKGLLFFLVVCLFGVCIPIMAEMEKQAEQNRIELDQAIRDHDKATEEERAQERKISFANLSRKGDYMYPFSGGNMLSDDGSMLLLKNVESDTFAFCRTDNQAIYKTNIENVFDDPREYYLITNEGYSTVFFYHNTQNTICSYDRRAGRWINKEGAQIALLEEEDLYGGVSYTSSIRQEDDRSEDALLFIYNYAPDVDCISKLIRVYPDCTYSVMDISEYRLKHIINSVDRDDCNCAIMIDRNYNLKVLDADSGKVLDISYQAILDDYIPLAFENNGTICEDKNYIKTQDGYYVAVWDLETGKVAFEHEFAEFNSVYFSDEHEIVYFSGEDYCLYKYDLKSQQQKKLMDKEYFEDDAFMDQILSFSYSDEYDICIFATSDGYDVETLESEWRIVITDLNGKVLAVSDELKTYDGSHFCIIGFYDNILIANMRLADTSVEPKEGIYSYLFRAIISVDENGNLIFE